MAKVTASRLAALALQREAVDTVFYILSAPIVADCIDLGMQAILTRNETGAGMMAHGVVPSLANALADACPVIAFGASAALSQRHTDGFQEMDQIAMMRPVTKWAHQATHAHKMPEYVSIAFRHALAPPHGPVYLDMPNDVVGGRADEDDVAWPVNYRTEARAYGDRELIRRAVDLLVNAERPLVVTGSGVLWSGASSALEAFVDATGIPFYTTPQGRGVVPEDHPRCFPGARSMAFKEADVVLVVGARANVLLSLLRPPRWSPDAKFIIANLDPREIGHNAPAEIGIVGDAKSVLSQLTEAAGDRFAPTTETAWVQALRERDTQRAEQTAALMDSDDKPMHPLRLCREVRDFIDRDAILVVDGHEILNFARQSIPSYVPGHRINSGTHGTMGVGVPFGIGAQAAKLDKQVVVLTGDGAFGWNGMEIDTALRHRLPILFVVCNNGSYTAQRDDGPPNPQQQLGFQRYDRMMEAFGGHGEWVENAEDIRPALDRAAASGKTALVNVKVDPRAASSTQIGMDMDAH
jgi:acetolactate synthase-1/2/3 large subunit